MPVRANEIMKFMTAPSKVADTLDWRKLSGSILTMDIGHKCIGLAVACHPTTGEPIQKLEALKIQLVTKGHAERALSPSVLEHLQEIVHEHNVCGFVVSWPLQKEGRAGAPCGKVLHTLDSLVNESSTIVTRSRPFCLWDDHHFRQDDDEWGRSQVYAKRTTNKLEHKASEEQYAHECSSSLAVDVWNDFCRQQWPELYQVDDTGKTLSVEEDSDLDFAWLSSFECAQTPYTKVAQL